MYYSKKWEALGLYSDRLKVPGGWIVRSAYAGGGNGAAVHTIFIEDEEHTWKLED